MEPNADSLLVTVITVCYNCENLIADTMSSVISQDYSDIEYILVDGGSTDNTVGIIEKASLEDRRIKYVSEPDKGIYDAMNKGLRRATGDIIYFVNAGDRLYTINVISRVVEAFVKYNCDIVYGRVLRGDDIQAFEKVDRTFFLQDKMVSHQGLFVKKNIFDKTGLFDTKFKLCADFDWLIKCFKKKADIIGIPEIVAYYDLSGVSSLSRKAIAYEHTQIIRLHFGYINLYFLRVLARSLLNERQLDKVKLFLKVLRSNK